MRVGVDALARDAMEGAACFTLDCEGTLRRGAPVEPNYYSNPYQSTNTRTVVAAEHTGLVPTKKRKRIENQFKAPVAQQVADSPNVLVATPTLEMGIDIGDLLNGERCWPPCPTVWPAKRCSAWAVRDD